MIANVNNFRESKRRSTFVLQNRIDGNLLNHHRNSNNESSKMPNQSINSSKLELLDKRRLSNNFFSLGTLKKFKMRNSIKDGSPLKSLFKKMETLKDGAFYQFFISTRNSLIGIDIVLFFLIVLNIFLSFVSVNISYIIVRGRSLRGLS